jgi:hypothetical protein
MNKDNFGDASSDNWLWKCSQGFIITLKSSFLVELCVMQRTFHPQLGWTDSCYVVGQFGQQTSHAEIVSRSIGHLWPCTIISDELCKVAGPWLNALILFSLYVHQCERECLYAKHSQKDKLLYGKFLIIQERGLEMGEYLQFKTSVYDCVLGFVFYCSECVVMSQEILKNEEAMYLQMIKQPSELEGLQQGRQETERWKLGNVFIFVR